MWIKDPDSADPKRPFPTESGSRSATLVDSIQSKTDEFEKNKKIIFILRFRVFCVEEHDPINTVAQIIVQKDLTGSHFNRAVLLENKVFIRLSHLNRENKINSFKKRYVAHVSEYKY